jgi:N-ethylmaleimide reductase
VPLLFEPYQLSDITLANRIVMAPMTRSRAVNHMPNESTAQYYAQRASAGLIITEDAPVSPEARGWLWTPGIYTDEQLDGWRKVTETVHQAGGRIYVKLWHVGRMSHVSLQENGQAPVSSVDTQAVNWPVFAYDDTGTPGQIPASPARQLTVDEIRRITDDFVRAASNAIAAGFDGVELHSAEAYLFDQFINAGINTRNDEYGGNPDLVERFRNGWPLTVADRETYYGRDDRGYTDFPPYVEPQLPLSGHQEN